MLLMLLLNGEVYPQLLTKNALVPLSESAMSAKILEQSLLHQFLA